MGNRIVFDKPLSNLDRPVLRFVKLLEEQRVNYVIVSEYIAILFDRSRNTEDVDMFIEEMPIQKFAALRHALEQNGFECLNTPSPEEARNHYLNEKLAVRFAEKGTFEPNFELKYPKTRYNEYSLKNKVEVVLNCRAMSTSEIELQIAFKLSLESDKDFEDARHLYNVFKGHLDMNLLKKQVSELGVGKQARVVLWKKD